ncbi:unnamed protein product [Linum trigynum]|uniref:Formin-like protein n=1 Tax=Linum trigynum TaxID=586398 RepID=A0AAV2F745_9ROSI
MGSRRLRYKMIYVILIIWVAMVDSSDQRPEVKEEEMQPSPLGPKRPGASNDPNGDDDGGQKAKLKPFFWDKVMASPNRSMVWHDISSGSFQFDEEMIESLFGYNANKNKNERKREVVDNSVQYIQIIDPRKAQNLSILLKSLNVTTEEVLDALREANELPVELPQTLLKMASTANEELKLRLYAGEISQLGPAELTTLKESFVTLEVASNKLKNSRLFLKLLEAVLKTGNRMNDGTYRGGAQAFKLDTLLKLSDVKGIDGKTTLLHFVVLEIIRSEGVRAVRSFQRKRRGYQDLYRARQITSMGSQGKKKGYDFSTLKRTQVRRQSSVLQQQEVEDKNHHNRLFPAIVERRNNESSSSDDGSSGDEDY